MNLPSMLKGESLERLLQGTAFGAVAAVAAGFYFGGWMLSSTAATESANNARSAVVAALAPICADNFQKAADAQANLVTLKKESTWQQASFVEKGGWAVLPGSDAPGAGVAKACAEILRKIE